MTVEIAVAAEPRRRPRAGRGGRRGDGACDTEATAVADRRFLVGPRDPDVV